MDKQSQKNMNVTFMLVPLNAADKRKIKRRVSRREPVVFLETSASTRKQPEAKAASEQVSTLRKNKGLIPKEPVIFLDKLASTQTPEVNFTFGSPSTQTRIKKQKEPFVSVECSASKKEEAKVVSPSTQRRITKQKVPVVSGERPASKKQEAKAASQQPAMQSWMRKGPKQREHKRKAPSEESATLPHGAEKDKQVKPKEVISCVRTILDKLTPETFQDLMKQLQDVTVDTEERLNSVIDLIFEKAMLKSDSSVLYANMCRCLTKVKVPTKDDPKLTLSFQTLLIRRCQAEFQKNHSRHATFEERQSRDEEEQLRLKMKLDDAEASHRSVSNIEFMAELFRLKMLSDAAMHSCIQTLLNNQDEESLECLCLLLNSIGKELELLTAKRVMDRYFNKVEDIIKEGKTSSRVSDLLKDTADLRERNWMPECIDIDQIFMEDEHPDESTASLSSALQSSSGHCTVPQMSSSESAVSEEESALPSQDAASSSAAQPVQDTEESHLFNILKHDDEGDDNSQPEKKQVTCQTLSFIPVKVSLTEDEMENFSEAVINDYLRTNDLKEALHIMSHLTRPSVLHVFVRNVVDLTFEHSSRTRRQAGLLLLELVKLRILPTEQFFKGLKEILEVADYISADVPEIWLCLAELLSPMLHEGGISMAQLFGKIKTLVPLGPAGVLLAHILTVLSNSITQKDIKVMWNNAGVKWEDFLHSSDNVRKFKADWMVEYTEGEEADSNSL